MRGKITIARNAYLFALVLMSASIAAQDFLNLNIVSNRTTRSTSSRRRRSSHGHSNLCILNYVYKCNAKTNLKQEYDDLLRHELCPKGLEAYDYINNHVLRFVNTCKVSTEALDEMVKYVHPAMGTFTKYVDFRQKYIIHPAAIAAEKYKGKSMPEELRKQFDFYATLSALNIINHHKMLLSTGNILAINKDIILCQSQLEDLIDSSNCSKLLKGYESISLEPLLGLFKKNNRGFFTAKSIDNLFHGSATLLAITPDCFSQLKYENLSEEAINDDMIYGIDQLGKVEHIHIPSIINVKKESFDVLLRNFPAMVSTIVGVVDKPLKLSFITRTEQERKLAFSLNLRQTSTNNGMLFFEGVYNPLKTNWQRIIDDFDPDNIGYYGRVDVQ